MWPGLGQMCITPMEQPCLSQSPEAPSFLAAVSMKGASKEIVAGKDSTKRTQNKAASLQKACLAAVHVRGEALQVDSAPGKAPVLHCAVHSTPAIHPRQLGAVAAVSGRRQEV